MTYIYTCIFSMSWLVLRNATHQKIQWRMNVVWVACPKDSASKLASGIINWFHPLRNFLTWQSTTGEAWTPRVSYRTGDIWKLIMCKSCIFNIYIYIYNKIFETLATTACSLWTKIDEFHLPKQLPFWSYMYLPLRWNLSNIFIFIPTKRGCLCVVPWSTSVWKHKRRSPSSVLPW